MDNQVQSRLIQSAPLGGDLSVDDDVACGRPAHGVVAERYMDGVVGGEVPSVKHLAGRCGVGTPCDPSGSGC